LEAAEPAFAERKKNGKSHLKRQCRKGEIEKNVSASFQRIRGGRKAREKRGKPHRGAPESPHERRSRKNWETEAGLHGSEGAREDSNLAGGARAVPSKRSGGSKPPYGERSEGCSRRRGEWL